MRLLSPQSFWWVLFAGYVPYALLGYAVALVALLVLRTGVLAPLRRWVDATALLAVVGLGFHAALLLPAFVGDHPEGPVELTVLSLNMRLGHGDPAAAVDLVRRTGAQVVVLEEVTPALAARLRADGLTRTLPYVAGAAGPAASGTLVLSAYPLTRAGVLPLHHGSYQVRVAAPLPFWLVAVHLDQPIKAPGAWRADWDVLNTVVPGLSGQVVVAGDFNTTLDHAPMRTLLGRGFADAARASNAGWQPTWPHRLGLIAIDHVLTRGRYGAVSTATALVPGTDHRGLVARFAVVPPSTP